MKRAYRRKYITCALSECQLPIVRPHIIRHSTIQTSKGETVTLPFHFCNARCLDRWQETEAREIGIYLDKEIVP